MPPSEHLVTILFQVTQLSASHPCGCHGPAPTLSPHGKWCCSNPTAHPLRTVILGCGLLGGLLTTISSLRDMPDPWLLSTPVATVLPLSPPQPRDKLLVPATEAFFHQHLGWDPPEDKVMERKPPSKKLDWSWRDWSALSGSSQKSPALCPWPITSSVGHYLALTCIFIYHALLC